MNPGGPVSHFAIDRTGALLLGVWCLDREEARLIRDHREAKRRERHRQEQHAYHARRLRERLTSEVWETREGELVPVSKMTPRHAENAVRFALGVVSTYRRHAAQAGPEFGRSADPVSDDRWPLVAAMTARANEEPSLRDRLTDRRNTRRFERTRNR